MVRHHAFGGPRHPETNQFGARKVGKPGTKYKYDCVPDRYNPHDFIHIVHPSGKAQFRAQLNWFQRKFTFCAPKAPPEPPAGMGIDLRPLCQPIVDQGSQGSCTGESGSAFREVLKAVALGQNKPLGYYLSASFLYAEERMAVGQLNQDNGASLADGANVMQTIGICPASDMPYSQAIFNQAPSAIDVQQAAAYRIGQPYRADFSDPAGIKKLLYAKMACWTAISVYSSWEDCPSSGILTIPNTQKEKYLGGHAILIVGYDDSRQWYICRNSWSTSWGDNGYAYMPYGYASVIQDAWVANPC